MNDYPMNEQPLITLDALVDALHHHEVVVRDAALQMLDKRDLSIPVNAVARWNLAVDMANDSKASSYGLSFCVEALLDACWAVLNPQHDLDDTDSRLRDELTRNAYYAALTDLLMAKELSA